MTFVKWGMAAAVALALSPAYAQDTKAQKDVAEARQDAEKQKADAQKDAAEKKADAQKEMSEADRDAQKKMSDADREAREKTAKAEQKADEKAADARQDAAKKEGEARTSDDRAAATDRTYADSSKADSKKAPLSATAKETLKKLHADSEMEVGMARIAKDKAQNDKVKDLADKIQDDHQKMVDKTSDLARDHNVELATHGDMNKNRKHVEQMNKMSGASFDRHYADMMAKEHRKDIAELRKVQPKLHANKGDADVAKLVDDALDKLQSHEKLAIDAQTALKKDQRQGRSAPSSSNTRSGTSTWPQTDANTNSGADVATGPHTGADADAGHTGSQGEATGTRTQSPANNPTDNPQKR